VDSATAESVVKAHGSRNLRAVALDGGRLGEAVAAINRYNRIQIRLAEPELARLSVTGAFQVRNPDAFARAVAATFGLGIDRSDPGVILLRRAP